MRTVKRVQRSIVSFISFVVAAASIASAEARWVVEQIYSNANAAVQFIVLAEDGGPKCSGFSIVALEEGAVRNGIAWQSYEFPKRLADSHRLLLATPAFEALTIVQPDISIWAGFFAAGPGVIQLCDGVEFSYNALPLDGVMALDATGSATGNVASNAAGASGSVTAQQAASMHTRMAEGHSGSWYDPDTSGQGFEVEIVPDWDFQHVLVSWFTYDAGVPGEAEGQRWYVLYGHADGGSSVLLDIFRNVGGVFNAGPITTGEKIGTSRLTFTACDRGTLDYAFTDGTGRLGSITLSRLTKNVICTDTYFKRMAVDTDFALSGNWYDPATSGQGISVEINPVSGVAFLAWYTYAPRGAATGAAGQRWYTAQAPYAPGARTLAMTIYETTGGLFDAAPPTPRTRTVGTATLAFQSCEAAALTYSFTGGSSAGEMGTIPLRRVIHCPI